MKSGSILFLVVLATEAVSFVIPAEVAQKNPGLVRRMTDSINQELKRVAATDSLDEGTSTGQINAKLITKRIGSRTVEVDAAYYESDEDPDDRADEDADDSVVEVGEDVDLVELVKRIAGGAAHGRSGGRSYSGENKNTTTPDSKSHRHAVKKYRKDGEIGETPVFDPAANETRYRGGGAAAYIAGYKAPDKGLKPPIKAAAESLWPSAGWHMPNLFVYRYDQVDWSVFNSTLNKTETQEIACVCSQFTLCTCAVNKHPSFIDDVLGNGTYADLQTKGAIMGKWQDTPVIMYNGTVKNGTLSSAGVQLNKNQVLAISAGFASLLLTTVL